MSRLLVGGVLFILMLATLGLVPSIYADLPPPIEWVATESGGLYVIASNVSMPEAIVNASIHLSGSWNYDVNVSCRFTISSLISQNLSTAFVYPTLWTHFTPMQNVTMDEFNIWANGTLVEYSILQFDEFTSEYDLNQTDWQEVRDCNFALFNFSIDSEEPITVDVFAGFRVSSSGHEFIFDYIVDTARRWEGNTHEIVRLEFERDNGSDIIEYRYTPDNSSEFSGDDYSAVVTWDLTIQEFQYDRVRLIVQQREYPIYHHVTPQPFSILGVGALVALGLVSAVLAKKRLQS